MSFNTYGARSKSLGMNLIPVWVKVDGVYQGGGKLHVDSSFAREYRVGTVIPAGTACYLDKAGGVLKPAYTYELAKALAAADVKAVFKGNGYLKAIKQGDVVMVAPTTVTTTGAAYAVGVVTEDADGNYEVAITANAWGTAAAGTIFVVANSAGASGKLPALVPNGLLWHDIVVEEGDTSATGALVYEGAILSDRVPPIPACYAKEMSRITLIKEV